MTREELVKDYSLGEIRETAINMHNYLREIKMRNIWNIYN